MQKIANLLDTTFDDKDLPRLVTKKWIKVHDQSGENCNVNKEIRTKTPMLTSDLCDFSGAYIVVEGKVTASFNPRKSDYDNNDFPDALFPNYIFPPGNTAEQVTAARNVAKTAAVNAANDVANDARNLIKCISFENNAPFINCISKINGILIDNAEDLDVAISMYNLLEYSKNYRKTTGSWWNYYIDEPTSDGEINHY